jgi:hypothetical protein
METAQKRRGNGARKKHINMRLPKVEVERREKAIVKWFMQNPNATGESMNKALKDGTVTGKHGEPLLNIKRVYLLRTQARQLLAEAERPPALPASEFRAQRRFGAEAAVEGPQLTEVARKHLQGLLGEFRNLAPEIYSLTARRDGSVGVGRSVVVEQPLDLASSAKPKA